MKIDSVSVISNSERVSFVLTRKGGFLVACIPDAREDQLEDLPVLARADSITDAICRYRQLYGCR